jgi:hypothetical protein
MIRPPVRPVQMNGSVAPVCPIVRSQPIPGQPPTKQTAIPPATDLPSAIRAINQIINIYNLKPLQYVETNRVTQTVRVYNPNDKEQWVDVERINSLTMQDPVTGGLWQWTY